MTIRRSRVAALAMGTAALLAVAGCTSTGDDPDAPERIVVTAIQSNPDNLNPQVSTRTPQTLAAMYLEPLIYLNDEYEVAPALADSWEIDDGGLTLTLHLVEANWHDGEPFTSADVKFNLEEVIGFQQFGAPLRERIASVETPDERTAVVHLSESFGPLLESLSQQFMIPAHIYEGTDIITNPANLAPIGTGPFVFEEFRDGEQISLVKNEDYWGGETQVDRVVSLIITDANARATALFADEIDTTNISNAQLDRLGEFPHLTHLSRGYFPQVASIMFNANSPYFGDPEVRKLVFAALDRDVILDTALGGYGQVANGFLPAESWAADADIDFDADFPRDVDAINAGLDAAGFPVQADGTRFTLDVRYITSLVDIAATAEVVRSQLDEVGIALNLLGTDGAVFTDKVYKESEFDFALLMSTLGPDPSLGASRWYTCNEAKQAAANPSGICDPTIDAAAEAAYASFDRDERAEALSDLQQQARDLMFYAPLAWTNGTYAVVSSTRWAGLDANPPGVSIGNWLTITPVG